MLGPTTAASCPYGLLAVNSSMITAVPGIKFGLAFCEASGKCLVRWSGTDAAMIELAKKNAAAIGAGHNYIVIFRRRLLPVERAEHVENSAGGVLHFLCRSPIRRKSSWPRWSKGEVF